MATTTTNFGWDIPQSTDLVKDGATAIAALGQDIDTALVDLKGGTTGQVLAKATNTDLDFTWVAQDDSNAIQNAIVDAKGDLISATAADTPARLAVGTNGQVLTADSTTATGLKWATPAGGGKILQVVQATYDTSTLTTSTSYVDTGLSVSITPSATTSRVLVIASQQFYAAAGSTPYTNFGWRLLRGATAVLTLSDASGINLNNVNSGAFTTTVGYSYVDSPSTTSSTTYKTQMKANNSGNTIYAQQPTGSLTTLIALEIGA